MRLRSLPPTQPERINPMEVGAKYDQRSDVWSYGITLVRERSHDRSCDVCIVGSPMKNVLTNRDVCPLQMHTCTCMHVINPHFVLFSFPHSPIPWFPCQYELATGTFPYPVWKNMFEQLKTVVDGPAPRVPGGHGFTDDIIDYIHKWLV